MIISAKQKILELLFQFFPKMHFQPAGGLSCGRPASGLLDFGFFKRSKTFNVKRYVQKIHLVKAVEITEKTSHKQHAIKFNILRDLN